MDKRIKELAVQAEDDTEWSHPSDYHMHSEAHYEWQKKFAESIIKECADTLVQSNMANPAYSNAMDAYYEQKWSHRFD